MQFTATTYEVQRRGTRIRAQIPLLLTGLDAANIFSERCHTLVVNPHGCGLRLSRPLGAGTLVRLDELPCGYPAGACVVSCVALGTDWWLVGLALDTPANVWCIQPAPADWSNEVAAASADSSIAVCPAEKKPAKEKENEWPYAIFSSKGEAHPGRR